MDMRKQTIDALANIDRQLAKAGTDKSRLLQATVYITDMALKAQMNEVWLGWIDPDNAPQRARSEEHTYELQSLMRISYAVLCLKNKHTVSPHLYRMEPTNKNISILQYY